MHVIKQNSSQGFAPPSHCPLEAVGGAPALEPPLPVPALPASVPRVGLPHHQPVALLRKGTRLQPSDISDECLFLEMEWGRK